MTEEIIFNPREYNDNLGTMLCFHKKYDLGDKIDNFNDEDCHSWQDIENELKKQCEAYLLLPLYLYDHSGITIGTKPFSCRFDSGQIGYIFVSREKIKSEFNCQRITQNIKVKVFNVLESEVQEYRGYIEQ